MLGSQPPGAFEGAVRLAALVAYGAAAFASIHRFTAPGRAADGGRRVDVLAVAAITLHAVVLGILWRRLGRPPFGDLPEALLVCGWLTALAFLLLGRTVSSPALGTFMLPLAGVLYMAGLVGPASAPPRGTDFANPWFQLHVAAFFIAYAAFAVAFSTGLMYLLLAREIRRKHLSRVFARLPSLEALDLVGLRAVWCGLPLAAAGLVSGAVWTNVLHHELWPRDPKVVAAAVTVLVYAGYLVGRYLVGWRGRRAALLAIVGFALSVFTMVGGSLLGPHGQGF